MQAALGLESVESRLERRITYFKAAQWLNAREITGSVLILGDSRSAWIRHPVEVASHFEPGPLRRWLDQVQTPQELTQAMLREGISTVLINFTELSRVEKVASPGYRYFASEEKRRLFKAWLGPWASGERKQDYRDENTLIFTLRPGEEK